MKLQAAFVVFATAAVTTVFTVSLLAPGGVGAVDAPARIKSLIVQPRFVSQGCAFALKTDKADYPAGDTPVIELTASNPTDKTVAATVWVNLSASAPASPMARMLPVPKTLWSHPCVVTLKPGESTTLSLKSEAKLPAGQNIAISITDRQRAILATSLSTPKTNGPTGQMLLPTQTARVMP